MCEDKKRAIALLELKSVTTLASGKTCCSLNNGNLHQHCVEAENQRREIMHIKGTVSTLSQNKQLSFTRAGRTSDVWTVDFLAYGQQVSPQHANILIGSVHSPIEDIRADLEYDYDDPFSSKGYKKLRITIQGKLK